ncbi:MAG: WYL domain-containing protein [archaeon]
MDIIQESIDKKTKLVIHYCDAFRRHTSRIITPKKIIHSDYDNTAKIESFCHKKNENRTFYLERIRDAAFYVDDGFCL